MGWLDCRLAGQLRNALGNREQPRDLDNGELELADGCDQQPLAGDIQLVTRTWLRPGLGRACDELLVTLTAPAMPMGDTRAMRSCAQLQPPCRPGARPGMPGAVAT